MLWELSAPYAGTCCKDCPRMVNEGEPIDGEVYERSMKDHKVAGNLWKIMWDKDKVVSAVIFFKSIDHNTLMCKIKT